MSVSRPLARGRISRRRAASLIVRSSALPFVAASVARATPSLDMNAPGAANRATAVGTGVISHEVSTQNLAGTALGVAQERSDAERTGTVAAGMPGIGITGQPGLRWWWESLSPLTGSVVTRDGVAFVADGLLGGGTLLAIDLATGAERWRAQLDGQPFAATPAIAPVADNDLVIVGTILGTLHALDSLTGTPRWEAQLAGDNANEIISSAAVVGDMVFVRTTNVDGSTVFALDTSTGAEVWRTDLDATDRGPIGAAPAVSDGQVYIASSDTENGGLTALDASTGRTLWTHTPDLPGLTAPVVLGGLGGVAGGDFVVAGGRGGLVSVDAADGSPVWTAAVGEVFSAPAYMPGAAGGGTLIVQTRSDLVAVDAFDGTDLWRYASGGSYGSPVTFDGSTVVVGSDGSGLARGLHLVDAATGERRWHLPAAGEIRTSPVVIDIVPEGDMAGAGAGAGAIVVAGDEGLMVFGETTFPLPVDEGGVIATLVGPLTFGAGVDANEDLIAPGSAQGLPAGTASIGVRYDHLGVTYQTPWRMTWLLDGEVLNEADVPWERDATGRSVDWITANSGALPSGTYEVVIAFGGVEAQRGTVTIGP